MQLIRAIIRPESRETGGGSARRNGTWGHDEGERFGKGREKSIGQAPIEWDDPLTKHNEIPKVMLLIAVDDPDVQRVSESIITAARTGNVGDGKIFITPIEEAYTVSARTKGL